MFDINLHPNLEKGQFTPSIDEMAADAFVLLNAGMDTLAYTMVVITWALLHNPPMMQKLKAELRSVMPSREDTVDWAVLEKLSYMVSMQPRSNFCCKADECSVPSSKRVSASPTAPQDALPASYLPQAPFSADRTYQLEHVFPPHIIHQLLLIKFLLQTVVSSSTYVYHQDSHTFKDPETFQPERWLADPTDGNQKEMESRFVPFSRGSRACIGINLAYAELHLFIAHLFRRFKIENAGTSDQDMEWVDRFSPVTRGYLKVMLRESAD